MAAAISPTLQPTPYEENGKAQVCQRSYGLS